MPLPRPRDLPDYAEARRAGRTPPVGATPPHVLPGPSALHRLVALVSTAGVVVAVFIGLIAVSPASTAASTALTIESVLGAVAVLIQVPSFRRRQYAELQHGYTTLLAQFGYASGDRRRGTALAAHRLVWDYSGTWYLRSDGGIRRAPDRDRDAPGFYPSPDGSSYELWTGTAWSGRRSVVAVG